MAKYRKKPVVVEAMQRGGSNTGPLLDWCTDLAYYIDKVSLAPFLKVVTLEGVMRADIDDWIVKGIKGEFYPVKPDIFAATYEPVDGATQ